MIDRGFVTSVRRLKLPSCSSPGIGERRLSEVNANDLDLAWAVNCRGPLLVARHFADLLLKGEGLVGAQGSNGKAKHAAVLVNVSAHAASIEDNNLGGWYAYRISKCALNMANRLVT